MSRAARSSLSRRGAMTGMAAVEFALVSIMFVFILLAITDLGRWFFAANAASEAARLGGRLAVVCDRSAWTAGVFDRMQGLVTDLAVSNVSFSSYPSDSCVAYGTDPSTVCTGVSVTVSGLVFHPLSPYLPDMPIPSFKVTLPRESMATSLTEPVSGGPSTNPLCS